MVLDQEATPFTRVWCCFEQAMVVQGRALLLDFATVHEGKAELLTDGPAYRDEEAYARVLLDIARLKCYLTAITSISLLDIARLKSNLSAIISNP